MSQSPPKIHVLVVAERAVKPDLLDAFTQKPLRYSVTTTDEDHFGEFLSDTVNIVTIDRMVENGRWKSILASWNSQKLPGKVISVIDVVEENAIVEMAILGMKAVVDSSRLKDIHSIIRIVRKGGIYFSNRAAEAVRHLLSQSLPVEVSLTEFESKLIELLCKGESSRQIGESMHRSHRTIEEHREKLYKKFDAHSKEELITKVVRMKII